MRLSKLQKAILQACAGARGRIDRQRLYGLRAQEATKAKDVVDGTTKSLERLIDRGLLVGYGVRTQKKWCIKSVRLTPTGRRIERALYGSQQPLPLRAKKLEE
jgi:hypothetical protein